MAETTLAVPADVVAGVAPGASKCVSVGSHKLILYKSPDGKLRACVNKCEHMGGSFSPDLEDTGKMKCSLHAWRMDPSTMSYVSGSNPKLLGMTMKQEDGKKQPELTVAMNSDGSATLTLPEGAGGGGCSVV